MNEQEIKLLLDRGELWKRSPDKHRAASLTTAAIKNGKFAKIVPINEDTAVNVFKAVYDAFRQLGDAAWWKRGYEPRSHAASMKILMTASVKNNFELKKLERFRRIRHDEEYDGEIIRTDQAAEIASFWEKVSDEIIDWIKK